MSGKSVSKRQRNRIIQIQNLKKKRMAPPESEINYIRVSDAFRICPLDQMSHKARMELGEILAKEDGTYNLATDPNIKWEWGLDILKRAKVLPKGNENDRK